MLREITVYLKVCTIFFFQHISLDHIMILQNIYSILNNNLLDKAVGVSVTPIIFKSSLKLI